MRPAQQRWPQAMIATDLSATLRSVFELLAVVGIITCLVVSSLDAGRLFIARTQLSEAYWVSAGMRANMSVEHALTGHWAAESVSDNGVLFGTSGRYTEGARFKSGGGLDVKVREQKVDAAVAGKTITLRPFFYGTSGPTMVLWSCGRNVPPAGYVTQARDDTDVPPRFLPSQCRDR